MISWSVAPQQQQERQGQCSQALNTLVSCAGAGTLCAASRRVLSSFHAPDLGLTLCWCHSPF